MSNSVRLHHPTFASCNYVVELPQAILAGAKVCPTCSRPDKPVKHEQKALHLQLDANGDCFVSEGVLETLRQVPTMAGLEVVSAVTNAPPQFVGAVEQPRQEVITATNLRTWTPGRTRQESERIAQAPFLPTLTAIAEMYDRRLTAVRAEKQSTFALGK